MLDKLTWKILITADLVSLILTLATAFAQSLLFDRGGQTFFTGLLFVLSFIFLLTFFVFIILSLIKFIVSLRS